MSIASYALIAALAAMTWRAHEEDVGVDWQPVTILKPLHGDEPALLDSLRSFCIQDYPCHQQIVFGVRDAGDPALRIVTRLQREFPESDISCVVNPGIYGSNYKVCNLMNMLPSAQHQWLVLADSDIHVDPDYLRSVTAALASRKTGIVTCLYRAQSHGGIWSRLGAMFIDQWFAPSVLVSRLFGSVNFGFGATIALRREVLDAIGGFQSVVDHIADDYRLGELTRAFGWKTVLSHYVVTTSVSEAGLPSLLKHELRWLRTIRTVQPAGYALMFVSFGLPLAAALTFIPGSGVPALAFLLITSAARAMLHCHAELRSGSGLPATLARLPLVPIRDVLMLCTWSIGFFSRNVTWSGNRFTVAQDGSLSGGAP